MKRKTTKGTNKKNYYFTTEHEQAIIRYINEPDHKQRSKIYSQIIEPVFTELIDNIVYTWKFTNLPNINCLKEECKIHLVTIMSKYDEARLSKAYTYFTVITRNWFFFQQKQVSKQLRTTHQYEDIIKYADDEVLSCRNTYIEDRIDEEFWEAFWVDFEYWIHEIPNLKDNDRLVFLAIKDIFDKVDSVEIFNKKAVYLYLRELTNLTTKQIVVSLNKFRKCFREFKEDWHAYGS